MDTCEIVCPHCGYQTAIDPALIPNDETAPMPYCPQCDEPLLETDFITKQNVFSPGLLAVNKNMKEKYSLRYAYGETGEVCVVVDDLVEWLLSITDGSNADDSQNKVVKIIIDRLLTLK